MFNSPIGKRSILLLAVLAMSMTSLVAKQLAVMHKIEGSIEVKYNELIQKKIKTIGFKLSDPHKRVNDGYKQKYGSTDLEVLSFMSIANAEAVNKLIAVDPRIAGFTPFNMLIYKKSSAQSSYVGHLAPEVMLDIVGVTNQDVRKAYIDSFKPLDAMLEKEIGGEKHAIAYSNLPERSMMNFKMEFERAEDLEDSIDEIQEKFEEIFEDKNYIIAGYLNLKEADQKNALKDFDAFWVYSLCHFKFSYTLFDGKDGYPQAGMFAPCSMYMYIKKGSNTLVAGMPRLATWAATLNIANKEKLELIKQLDREIPSIMKKLGAVEIKNSNPLLTSPVLTKELPQSKVTLPLQNRVVIELPQSQSDAKKTVLEVKQNNVTYTIELPKVPAVTSVVSTPVRITIGSEEQEQDQNNTNVSGSVGEVKNSRVSAYLRASIMGVADARAKLESAGFRILSSSTVDKKGKLHVIVFTNETLETMANKKDRGFIASLRLLVDTINKQITISNPIYFAKAFLQNEEDAAASKAVLHDIKRAFSDLKDATDNLEHNKLAKYHFMKSMPYYKDMITVGRAKSTEALFEKIKKHSKRLVFSQKLSKDRILVGIELDKRTKKFIKKTGFENALLLPYPVLLENSEAKILDPKYYIAISYPMLKMSQFMKIATIPGAIEKDSARVFK
jgi:uncharacterized protein (DUF302 family)